MATLLATLLVLTSIFLIMLVLVQRGRGGGLAGALGGAGGQSALGTKAGDMFTRITIGAAAVWILLCIASVKVMNRDRDLFSASQGSQAQKDEAGAESVLPVNDGDAPAGSAPAGSE